MSFPYSVLRAKSFPTISFMSTGATLVYTLENSTQRFIPMFLHLEVITLTGTLVTSPAFSMGTNATSYNNVLSMTTPNLLAAVTNTQQFNLLASGAQSIAAGSTMYINVTTAAIGPSVYILRPDVIGYYV